MPNDHTEESAKAGGSEGNVPANGEAGETGKGTPDYQTMYKELEQKYGGQGQELTKFRDYIERITPLMENLSKMPELAVAIEKGEIDEALARAVAEGKVTLQEAEAATQVQKEAEMSVKKEIGAKGLKEMTQEDLDKLIEARMLKERQLFEEKLREIKVREEDKEFELGVEEFIKNTKDWDEYSEKVLEYIENHPVEDIQTAYLAVKGLLTEEEAAKKAEEAIAEEAKRIAENASGGGSGVSMPGPDDDIVDKLLGARMNPNNF